MYTRKTKIVCSIGPACDNDETVRLMIKAGMNIARFNFSHGTYEWHKAAMERVRRISEELGVPVGILLDTKGPEIRTGLVENDGKISISAGEKVEVFADDSFCYGSDAESGKICHLSLSWKDAAVKLRPGIRVLIADGLVELVVDKICGSQILCTAKNSGVIGSRKNVNLIGMHAGLPIMGEKDREDLKFGVSQDVDFVAASFVSFASEVVEIKEYLESLGGNARVIAKIENEEGLNNIEEIATVADGVMVARGDLGVQLPTERIPLAQKAIIRKCRAMGKPVITATQMLDSMIVNPRPTRAELTDVANAVFDGTDAVMLSGETAGGKYPVESVKTMALIAKTTELSQEYLDIMRTQDENFRAGLEVGNMVAHSAYKLARNLDAKAILIPTLHGNSARIVGNYRPEQIVLAVTPDKKVCRQLMIHWGVVPILSEIAVDSESMLQNTLKRALRSGAIQLFDKVVMCAAVPVNSTVMNSIRVIIVGEIIGKGTEFGCASSEKTRVGGRVIHEDMISEIREQVRAKKGGILVCKKITENLVPVLRIIDGVVSEGGSEIPVESLKLINPALVWIENVPNCLKVMENDLSVTLDGEQGFVYEGIL